MLIPATLLHSPLSCLKPPCTAPFYSVCFYMWFMSQDCMMEWPGKALANSRKEGEEAGEARAHGKCVPSLSAVFAKIQEFFSPCIEILFGFGLCTNSLVLKEMNDTLLKMIIDWMFGWMGCDCPPACRSGRNSFRGLNMIKPPPRYDSQLFSQELHTL